MDNQQYALPLVFVFGPGHIPYVKMFIDNGYKLTNSLPEADLVCFTGGEDVDPQLYGQKAHKTTHFNVDRDRKDMAIYHAALELDIPMVGICRGGQFLNVMNGGKMWQHVNNHGNMGHAVLDLETNKLYKCSSTHHQMMIAGPKGQVLATATGSTNRADDTTEIIGKLSAEDTEAVWYQETECLCFQPHPEFEAYKECSEYFFKLLEKYIGLTHGWFEPLGDVDDDPAEDEDLVISQKEMEERTAEFRARFLAVEKEQADELGTMFDTDTGTWVTLDKNGDPIPSDPLDEFLDEAEA